MKMAVKAGRRHSEWRLPALWIRKLVSLNNTAHPLQH